MVLYVGGLYCAALNDTLEISAGCLWFVLCVHLPHILHVLLSRLSHSEQMASEQKGALERQASEKMREIEVISPTPLTVE